MNTAWSQDFSYEYFRKLLKVAKKNFKIYPVSQALLALSEKNKHVLLLRHDIDVSLEHALKMAKIEHKMGIHATYMVLVESLLFSLEDAKSKNIVRRLKEMGHEVGIHFNIDGKLSSVSEIKTIEKEISLSCKTVEKIVKRPILSISFHRPRPEFTHGPLKVCSRINAYAKELMKWYISDSKGFWREGEPLPQLVKPEKKLLQLLIHPIWWGEKHMTSEARLQDFFDMKTEGMSEKNKQSFSQALKMTIPRVRRTGDIL